MSATRDVVVAGGGPAGAALAALLARAGADVLLVERDADGARGKLCGEFLSPEAHDVLVACGAASAVGWCAPARIGAFAFTAPRGLPLQRALPREALGLSRAALDPALREAARGAGAQVLLGTRLRHVEGSPGAQAVMLERDGRAEVVTARLLAMATGRAGMPGEAASTASEHVAFSAHHAPRGPWPSQVEIHAFLGGYAGLNTVEGGRVNLCWLARAEDLRHAGSADALLHDVALRQPHLAERLRRLERLEPWRAVARSRAFRPPADGRLRLGDATSRIAPACGDGMAMALRSAAIAAPLILQALAGRPWPHALDDYRRRARREFATRLLVGRALEAALLSPAAARVLVAAGRRLPALADAAFRLTRGEPARQWDAAPS